jgi:hypothetical protein
MEPDAIFKGDCPGEMVVVVMGVTMVMILSVIVRVLGSVIVLVFVHGSFR